MNGTYLALSAENSQSGLYLVSAVQGTHGGWWGMEKRAWSALNAEFSTGQAHGIV
jgi:hypothetical protein